MRRGAFDIEVLREHDPGRHARAQHIGRNLHVDRSRRIAVAYCGRPCLVEVAQEVVGRSQRAGAARHGLHDRDVVDALQRPEIVLRHRRAAADQQDRSALELRIGDRRHAVGDTGPRGRERDAQLARQHRMAVRHVHGGAFIAHVDNPHFALGQVVPDRLDVAALEAVHAVNTAPGDKLGDPFGRGSGRA